MLTPRYSSARVDVCDGIQCGMDWGTLQDTRMEARTVSMSNTYMLGSMYKIEYIYSVKHFLCSVYIISLFISRTEFIIAIVPAVVISVIPFPLEGYGPAGFWWYVYGT